MDKRNGILLFLCAAAVSGVLAYKLAQTRALLETQRQAMATLMAERDALKNKKSEPVICPTPLPAAEPQTEVQAVLDPQSGDAQSKMDALKKRYEDILVTYFVLRQCERVTRTDYHVIISAMAQEMASLGAPGRLQYDIVASAQGSYQEMYSANPCEPAATDALKQGYQAFIDAVAVQFMPK